jgi:tol-pal system protein YbgF
MDYLSFIRRWTGAAVACILVTMPACATFGKKEEDHKMVALQREVRQIERSCKANQKVAEELYERIVLLEDQIEEMNQTSEAVVKQLQSISVAPDQPGSQAGVQKAGISVQPPTSAMAQSAQPPVRKRPVVEKRMVASLKPTPEQQYDRAYSAYVQQRYDESLALFKAFFDRHPKHDLADNAQYWIGEIYYDMEDYPNAVLAFKEVVTKYADRNKAPDALLKIGYAYIAMDDPNNARIFLKRVIKNYPFSTAETMAQMKLKEMENL